MQPKTPMRYVIFFTLLILIPAPLDFCIARADKPATKTVNSGSAESVRAQPDQRPKRLTTGQRAAARRAAREAAARDRQEAEREQWLARLQARNVEPWPEKESDDQHAAALAQSRAMVEEVIRLLPGTELYETERFLFASNMPPEQVRPYAAYLDRMYDWMGQLYGVPTERKVWLGGKAPIFAFVERAQFEAFENKYFPEARQALRSLANVYGLCHLSPNGEVVIACYRGNDPHDFGQMLVHETSHGFIHRYRTKAPLPNWVDEGMADLIGAEMVPASTAVRNREFKAAPVLMQQRSLGGMLTAKRIEAWQYGVASNLNRFLLQTSRESYVRFIESLKEGMKWDEALREAYDSSPEELLVHYGRWIGVAELRP
jgi:hypothetical protein